MNNLATCLAQQEAPPILPGSKTTPLANARAWAKRALAVADSIPPGEDREECDQGCAVAMVNLGQIARMAGGEGGGLDAEAGGGGLDEGDSDGRGEGEARRWFEEAMRLSRKIGFEDGVRRADQELKSLRVNG